MFCYKQISARLSFDAELPDGEESFHVVDGGYYDNYGMVTLVEWLNQALEQSGQRANGPSKKVLVLQIKGAPVGADAPLSWHLTRDQQANIHQYWEAQLKDCYHTGDWIKVRDFLKAIP